MWKILCSSGIAPASVTSAYDDDKMLVEAGVGFTDVGTGFPGTDRLGTQTHNPLHSADNLRILLDSVFLKVFDYHWIVYYYDS